MDKYAQALQEIAGMDCTYITPAVAAKVMGCDPEWIRVAARDQPHLLKFDFIQTGKKHPRTKINRVSFLRSMGADDECPM